jgi:hypothetical protein
MKEGKQMFESHISLQFHLSSLHNLRLRSIALLLCQKRYFEIDHAARSNTNEFLSQSFKLMNKMVKRLENE